MIVKLICILLALIYTSFAHAEIKVTDDALRIVRIDKPARRIISLAPHVTELVYAAGAGKYLVGVSEYSDFPEEAKKIPSIGSIFALDLERILALKPDLVIIWGTGNAKLLANKLRDNKLTVFENEPHNFEDVASSIERIAILSGTENVGQINAKNFRDRLQKLGDTYRLRENQKPLSVFHEMVKNPLMTINRHHFISQMISLCGGRNIFAELKELSSTVTIESVLKEDPDLIFASGSDNQKLLNEWSNFPSLSALKKRNLYSIPGDWLHRAGPRMLDATELLCKNLALARTK